MRKITEDYIGTCQACFGEFKVGDDKLMVLHGFKRPGDGMTHGECAGYNHKPFEYEHTLTDQIIASLHERVAMDRKYLVALNNGEVISLKRLEEQYDERHRALGKKLITYTPADEKWQQIVDITIHRVEGDIRWNDGLIAYFISRVAAWKLLPIVGIDSPVTGRERGIAKPYDPIEAAAAEQRAADKAARDAKPGKLKLIFYWPQEKMEQCKSDAEWRERYDRIQADEKARVAEIKAVVKTLFPYGKPRVGKSYDSDLPRDIQRSGNFDVVSANIDWSYLGRIVELLPDAEKFETDSKKRSFTILRERG